jgi:hypothetical protein
MTERELMEKVTPGFVRWLLHYAPGFELTEDADRVGFMLIECEGSPVFDLLNTPLFPLLLHRTATGWNTSPENRVYLIKKGDRAVGVYTADSESPYARYMCYDYRADALTDKECALLHCLIEVYSEVCATAPVGEPV